MKQDLFNTPELLPQEVKDILAKYEEMGTSYDTCNNLVKELEQVGYTCDYGLDGIPYELTKIETITDATPKATFYLNELANELAELYIIHHYQYTTQPIYEPIGQYESKYTPFIQEEFDRVLLKIENKLNKIKLN
jgi:hypothetical protein